VDGECDRQRRGRSRAGSGDDCSDIGDARRCTDGVAGAAVSAVTAQSARGLSAPSRGAPARGVAADSGDSGDCTFTDCTFWGTTTWSVWVTKPGFTFTSCNIYGSFAHGYDSPDDKNATKFYNCTFEDKPYNGKPPYGNFLVETNGAKRMLFSKCNFISNTKKLCWFNSSAKNTEEKFQLDNCAFTINNANLPDNDFAGLIRGAALKNCTFTFTHPDAKKKRYHIGGYGESKNVDLGDNKTIFKHE